MGSKYKRKLEIEWAGKSLANIKANTIKQQTNANISEVLKGKYKRKGGYK